MPIRTDWIRYDHHLGYLAWPDQAATPLPSVVVIQEVWGVDAHIQDVTRRIAAAGYAALAPDLYAVDGQRPRVVTSERVAEVQAFMSASPPIAWTNPEAREAELAKLPGAQRIRIDETHKALFAATGGLERFVPSLLDATRYLRESGSASRGQKVACVGFCMGGGLSALLACHDPDLSGAAIFYGRAPPLDLVAQIRCPVVGFYGALDERINVGVPAFAEAMRAAARSFEHWIYQDARHGFFNDGRPSYDAPAVRDSFVRLLEFLRRATSS
jgi:carboxymethylenebutenolidase